MSPAGPTRALLIWNPVAGRRPQLRPARIAAVADGLRRGGWQVETALTLADGGAYPVALRAAESRQFEVLVACGGDGTLGQVAGAIARLPQGEPRPSLALVPCGTANIFAHAVGSPLRETELVPWLLGAQRAVVPLGLCENEIGRRYFLSVASVGFDAFVAHRVLAGTKKRWGKLAYVATACREAPRYRLGAIEYSAGDAPRALTQGLVIGLTPYYGGKFRLGRVEPGKAIELALQAGSWMLPGYALALATWGLEYAPGVKRFEGKPVHVYSPGHPVQVDGEPAGFTPARFDWEASGVEVLLRRT